MKSASESYPCFEKLVQGTRQGWGEPGKTLRDWDIFRERSITLTAFVVCFVIIKSADLLVLCVAICLISQVTIIIHANSIRPYQLRLGFGRRDNQRAQKAARSC